MNRTRPLTASSFLMLLAALSGSTGCVDTEADDGDGIDDSFLADGKSDAFGISEGSRDALAVLTLLRTASFDDLDVAAGLASNAAKAIVNHRQGGDRKDGTADDDPIESLTELDAIPYVGAMSFRLLLDHARATVELPSSDPFDPTFCTGDFALTMGDVRAAVPAGSQSIRIKTSVSGIRVRTRTCVTPDNCPEWSLGSQPNMFQLDGAETPANLSISPTGIAADMAVVIDADGRPGVMLGGSVQVDSSTTPSALLALQCYPAQLPTDDNAPITLVGCYTSLDDVSLRMTGAEDGSTSLVGTHCAQIVVRASANEGATHREVVYFARY